MSKKMLILARGDGRAFFDLQGRSIVADLPVNVTVFVDKANAHYFEGQGDHVETEVVRWSDLNDVARRAQALHERTPLSAIATLDEKTVDFAAELRERLGVPGLHTQDAARYRDKMVMKQHVLAAGLRAPTFVRCDDQDAVQALLAQQGKLVIKPVDGLGSKGVVFVSTLDELKAWFAAEEAPEGFEAETYVEGVLYHVNAIVRDGQAVLTASAPYAPGMANIDFASGTPFVTVMLTQGALKDKLEAFSARTIKALKLRNGVTHLECFVTPDEDIVFCEMAVRPGGGGIVWMIESQYGVNYGRATLLLECGRGDLIRIPSPTREDVAGLVGFRCSQTGIVKRAASAQSFSEPWIKSVQVDVAEGQFVPPSSHCTDYVGLVVFSSRDESEFHQRRNALYQRFFDALELQAL